MILVSFLDVKSIDTELVTEIAIDEAMIFLAPPSHPLANKPEVYPEDLKGEALILTEKSCSYRKIFEQILSQAAIVPRSILESAVTKL